MNKPLYTDTIEIFDTEEDRTIIVNSENLRDRYLYFIEHPAFFGFFQIWIVVFLADGGVSLSYNFHLLEKFFPAIFPISLFLQIVMNLITSAYTKNWKLPQMTIKCSQKGITFNEIQKTDKAITLPVELKEEKVFIPKDSIVGINHSLPELILRTSEKEYLFALVYTKKDADFIQNSILSFYSLPREKELLDLPTEGNHKNWTPIKVLGVIIAVIYGCLAIWLSIKYFKETKESQFEEAQKELIKIECELKGNVWNYYHKDCIETEIKSKLISQDELKAAKLKKNWSKYMGTMKWKEADAKCKSLGMRLPTISELQVAESAGITSYWKSQYPNWRGMDHSYWSSTPYSKEKYFIQTADELYNSYYPSSAPLAVRCRMEMTNVPRN